MRNVIGQILTIRCGIDEADFPDTNVPALVDRLLWQMADTEMSPEQGEKQCSPFKLRPISAEINPSDNLAEFRAGEQIKGYLLTIQAEAIPVDAENKQEGDNHAEHA